MDGRTYKSAAVMTSRMTAESCTVLATLADGSPAFISKAYGKGELFFLKAAIENNMADHMENLGDFYARFFQLAGVKRLVSERDPFIGVTEHPMEDKTIIVLVNYGTADGCAVVNGKKVTVPGNDFAVEIINK